jgi:hypothetical protein
MSATLCGRPQAFLLRFAPSYLGGFQTLPSAHEGHGISPPAEHLAGLIDRATLIVVLHITPRDHSSSFFSSFLLASALFSGTPNLAFST